MDLPLLAELQRRRVFRALVGYGIAAFAVLQIIEPVMHGLHWPDDVLSYVVVALAMGFPVVVSLAWIFDVKAGRIERTAPASAAPKGLRLGLLLLGIGGLAAAPGVVWYFVVRSPARPVPSSAGAPEAGPSIAVLPFADMSPGKDQEYFSDGIAEEILNALAQVEGLRVTGRTSSFSFKGKNEDLRIIGQKLGVGAVLEGSVRKEGNRVRVTAQVVKVSDGFHLWSQTYDRDLPGIFVMQGDIAKAVVEALKVKLLPGGEQPASRARTANLEAYEQYLLGTHLVASYGPDDVRRAIIAFEKAVSLDPTMPEAWARLSLALWWNNDVNTSDAANARRRAIAAAERTVALDPSLADGYVARSLMRDDFQWDFAGADQDDARAVALTPNSPSVLVLHCINRRSRGRFAESADACRRAIEIDPLTVAGRNQLTFTYLVSEEIAKARAVNSRALEVSLASQAAQFNRCALDILEGSRVEARDHCASLADEEDRLFGKAMISQEWGPSVEAEQSLAAFVARFGEKDPATVADLFAWRGDADRAFQWLDRAYDRHVGLSGIKGDWALQKIRSDARYAALLKKMRLPPN